MKRDEVRMKVQEIRGQMRVVEICCSRKLSEYGESTFVSYKVDLGEDGASLEDAKVATVLLGLEVDQAALGNAVAGGVLSSNKAEGMRKGIRGRYGALLGEKTGLVSEAKEDSENG